MSTAIVANSVSPWSYGSYARGVYVVELAGSKKFAFEAVCRADAEAVVRAAWFAQALHRFRSSRIVMETAESSLRVATNREAAFYRDLTEELADETCGFLVAQLDWDEQSS
jgi:hypothetical protein